MTPPDTTYLIPIILICGIAFIIVSTSLLGAVIRASKKDPAKRKDEIQRELELEKLNLRD